MGEPAVERRGLRIAAGLVATALAAILAARVHLDGDVGRLLPDSDPGLRQTSAVVGRAMQKVVIDLGLPDAREDRLELLMTAADRLAAEMEASENVERARATMLDGDLLETSELLVAGVPRLLDPERLGEVEARLEPTAIRASLATLARRAHEPDAGWLLSEALRDPFGISGLVLGEMDGMLAGFQDVSLHKGYITTADGSHLLMFVEPAVRPTDTEGSLSLLAELDEAFDRLRATPELKGIELRHLGAHRSTIDNQDSIRRDVLLTSFLGGIFVALVAILTLARTWWGLLAMLPAGFGGLVALGAVSLVRDSVATPVLGFGVALLGISVDYSIHVLYRLDARGSRLPVRALFMGATTTAFAFLALGVSSLPALREVGWLGAIGIVAAAVFAVAVLPALAGRPADRRKRLDLKRLLARGGARPARGTLVLALLATAVLAAGVSRLRFDGEVSRLSSLSPAAAADEAAIKQSWGEAFRTAQVVVAGASFQEALARDREVLEVLEEARTAGALRDFSSLSSLLPTVAEQEHRLASWRAFWSIERVEALRRNLATACDELGFQVAAFEPFFAWIASEPPALDYVPGDTGPLASLAEDRVLPMGEEVLVAAPVFVTGWEQVEGLQHELAARVPGATVISNEALSRKLAQLVVGELWKLGLCAFAAVVVLVALWLRAWRPTLWVIVPLLVSSVWTLGALGWLGIPINLANSVFAGFLFGIAVDYAIFMVQARLEGGGSDVEGVRETDASVLLCALTTCIAFGALALARHPVLSSIGATALTGVLAAFLATRIVVPWLAGGAAGFPRRGT